MSAYAITAEQRRESKFDLRKIPALSKQRMDHMDLPAQYKAAKAALIECWRVDELKDIGDKHSAIALYAKQAKDQSLLYYAERIKLRSYARIGELLKDLPNSERTAAAKANGVAATTAATCHRIAHIPPRVREQMIEAMPPPSSRRMSDVGRGYMDAPGGWSSSVRTYFQRESKYVRTPRKSAELFYEALHDAEYALESTMRDGTGGSHSIKRAASEVPALDASTYRDVAERVMALIDEFEQYLPKEPS
jgi:hypothetical protein